MAAGGPVADPAGPARRPPEPAGKPVAILAGSGRLPLELADHLKARGRDHRLLAFRGFADGPLRRRADAVCDLLDPAAILRQLERWAPACVTLVGAVGRPGLPALLGAYAAFRNRAEVRGLLARGDDHLLRGAVRLLEDHGHRVVGPHELAPDLAVPAGFRGGPEIGEEDRSAIATALTLLETFSPYDIGQAAVVERQRVLAVEGPEGTDRMLRRVAALRRSWFRRTHEGGVLVKAAKRGQDLRVDMPAIGPRTVVEAKRAGLSGIAVGAGSTLVLDRAETVRTAERAGLFVISVRLPWMGEAS
ncbi:MAG TPA: UDP-2,3-diacylglucosamine diphosphatase LpxI [Microvirga sp.]|nr:UDP-2,3-diacylglucosamine diphosphatase LpxI [Microvirga sp.]